MASKVFQTEIDLENYIESACEKAIENVAKIVTDKLEFFVDYDFYRMYKPEFYDRTYRFLKSRKYEMLSPNQAKVFIDEDILKYVGISADRMLQLAEHGYHGSENIFREGYFWEDFLEWCDENVEKLLVIELKKQGITIK